MQFEMITGIDMWKPVLPVNHQFNTLDAVCWQKCCTNLLITNQSLCGSFNASTTSTSYQFMSCQALKHLLCYCVESFFCTFSSSCSIKFYWTFEWRLSCAPWTSLTSHIWKWQVLLFSGISISMCMQSQPLNLSFRLECRTVYRNLTIWPHYENEIDEKTINAYEILG